MNSPGCYDCASATRGPVFEPLPFGVVRPAGWILSYMQEDLRGGTTGHLDRLVPEIFTDDIFHTQRRTLKQDSGDTGSIEPWADPSGAQELKWWNAETQGNWWDGFVRTALLAGEPGALARAEAMIQKLVSSQDADGYIGIYGPDMRYAHSGENGELWCQTVALRAMLGWAEARNDATVREAALRAIDHTIRVLTELAGNPFQVDNAWGGVGHGLMFTDVCEIAARITGQRRYLDFVAQLYRQFCEAPGLNDDVCLGRLMDREKPFAKHGVHTYEHFRSLLAAWLATGSEELAAAWEQAMWKLQPCLLPSGAGLGFENIEGLSADTERTSTEFCAMTELRNSYLSTLEKTGDPHFGDLAEALTFNGLHGARSKDARHLAYCMPDTCHCLTSLDPRDGQINRRYKFSPAHQDVAVCCAPNAARVHPYYVASMWAKSSRGLASLLYGPCTVETEWDGVRVSIVETTIYPFADSIRFEVRCDRPVAFRLSLRVPGWPGNFRLDATGITVSREAGWIHLDHVWSDEAFTVEADFEVEERLDVDGRISIHRGPLLFVLPVAANIEEGRDYGSGFRDLHFVPKSRSVSDHLLPQDPQGWSMESKPDSAARPWAESPVCLRGVLLKTGRSAPEEVELVPMAHTVLRKASFNRFKVTC